MEKNKRPKIETYIGVTQIILRNAMLTGILIGISIQSKLISESSVGLEHTVDVRIRNIAVIVAIVGAVGSFIMRNY